MARQFVGGSRVQGATSFRRLLRRIEPAARDELTGELNAIAQRLLGRAKAEAPRRTGRLAAALNARVYLGAMLRLRIGLLTKRERVKRFYAYILDQGRRAQTVTVKRKLKGGGVSTYALRVKPIDRERYNFVFGRRRDFNANELPKLRKVLDRILFRAAKGVGND